MTERRPQSSRARASRRLLGLGMAAWLLLAAFASCAAGGERPARPSQATAGGGLAIGLTEFDPTLIAPPGPPRPGIGQARAASLRLGLLRPRYFRLVVLWSEVQRRPGRSFNWSARSSGGYSVVSQLRALARARARAGGGWEPVVTFYSTPGWAREGLRGCEPPSASAQARAPRATALAAYQAMVRSLIALGRQSGVELRLFSAWNEPNSGFFLSPQRARCTPASPSLAPAKYAEIVRALRGALNAEPGDQQVVVGETSSPFRPGPFITAVSEFVGGLPADALCAGPVWAHHQYVGDADRVPVLKAALAARPCGAQPRRIWITETGVGSKRAREREDDDRTLRRGCRALHGPLLRWWADPQIDAAFQYTYREDPRFPVGLEETSLDDTYPAYWLWRAWGGSRQPQSAPPRLPAQCSPVR